MDVHRIKCDLCGDMFSAATGVLRTIPVPLRDGRVTEPGAYCSPECADRAAM